MKALLLAMLMMFGCSSGLHKSLEGMHRIGVLAHETIKNDVCRDAIEECKKLRAVSLTNPCEGMKKCQEVRRVTLRSIKTMQHAVLSGLIALQLANKPKAEEAISKGLILLEQIYKAFKTCGIKL